MAERWPREIDIRTFSANDGKSIIEEVVDKFMEVNADAAFVYITSRYHIMVQLYMPNIKICYS